MMMMMVVVVVVAVSLCRFFGTENVAVCVGHYKLFPERSEDRFCLSPFFLAPLPTPGREKEKSQ